MYNVTRCFYSGSFLRHHGNSIYSQSQSPCVGSFFLLVSPPFLLLGSSCTGGKFPWKHAEFCVWYLPGKKSLLSLCFRHRKLSVKRRRSRLNRRQWAPVGVGSLAHMRGQPVAFTCVLNLSFFHYYFLIYIWFIYT